MKIPLHNRKSGGVNAIKTIGPIFISLLNVSTSMSALTYFMTIQNGASTESQPLKNQMNYAYFEHNAPAENSIQVLQAVLDYGCKIP
jgi:hypothetical protein